MGDGSDMGVDPTRALETILGGAPQPSDDERRDQEELRQKIESAGDWWEIVSDGREDSYDRSTWALARSFMHEILRDPAILTEKGRPKHPDDYPYEPMRGKYKELPDALYDRCVRESEHEDTYGFTGFMVGYACNVALTALGYPPAQNPAIVSIGRD